MVVCLTKSWSYKPSGSTSLIKVGDDEAHNLFFELLYFDQSVKVLNGKNLPLSHIYMCLLEFLYSQNWDEVTIDL